MRTDETNVRCAYCGGAWSEGHRCPNPGSPVGAALEAAAGSDLIFVPRRGLGSVCGGHRPDLWPAELRRLDDDDLDLVAQQCLDMHGHVAAERARRRV